MLRPREAAGLPMAHLAQVDYAMAIYARARVLPLAATRRTRPVPAESDEQRDREKSASVESQCYK